MELEPLAYRYGLTPNEFWNLHYREARLFVESREKAENLSIKNEIMLAENTADKMIGASIVNKKPKNISLIKEIYIDLFREDLLKQGINVQAPREGQDLINFMYELSEELKEKK